MLSLEELQVKFKKENKSLKSQVDELASQIETSPTKVKLKRLSHYLAADVPLTLADTFYNGPSLTLPPGSWDLRGALYITSGAAANRRVTIKLWDGSTVVSSGEAFITTGDFGILPIFGQVTGGKSWTISAAADGASCVISVTPLDNAVGCTGTASYLLATRTDENLI